MENIHDDVATNLKSFRLERGMNQTQFATAIGRRQGSVSKWERGEESPRLDVIAGIAGAFEISIEEFLAQLFKPRSP